MADGLKLTELDALPLPVLSTDLIYAVREGVGGESFKVPVSELPAGGGAVDSVNGQVGTVELDAGDVGAVATGSVTGSGLTMNTARLLGRTTASGGAIEEITVGAGFTLAAGSLVVAAAQTTISSLTAPTNTALALATLDNNKDITIAPHGSGNINLTTGGSVVFVDNGSVKVGTTAVANTYTTRALYGLKIIETTDATEATSGGAGSIVTAGGIFAVKKLVTSSSLETGAPSGGTAAVWKLGVKTTNTLLSFDSANSLQVDVDGNLYHVALATITTP